jgi:hypothetical protein
MKPKAVQTLAWVLIYSGLLVAALGLFLVDAGSGLGGGVLLAVGLADAAAGVVLIWVRSRMKEDETP